MTTPTIKDRLVDRFLDPSSSLGEIVFGLIMVLTMTLGAGVIAPEGRDEARVLLLAAIGCNVAWGIIDGALYLMAELFERARMVRLRKRIERAPNDQAKLALIDHQVEEMFGRLLRPEDREPLGRTLLHRIAEVPPPPPGVRREDLAGAAMSFALVVLSCIPAAVPFLFIHDPRIALRVSNALLLGMLFITGWQWARYTGTNRFVAGFGLLVFGVVLVGVAMALGG